MADVSAALAACVQRLVQPSGLAMPVTFEIYRDGRRLSPFTPVGACVVGPESVPVPGEVSTKNGTLVVDRADDLAVGVSLLWDAGPVGSYHLDTTRLPPREQPYNLNVELARSRLMKIIQKQEDWNLFDFPNSEAMNVELREAQGLFAAALGKLDQPQEAAQLADQSLALAIKVSEDLSAFHAELLLNRRRTNGAFVRHTIGCRVNPQIQNQKYKDTAAAEFDYVVLPMSWKQFQPEEDAFETHAFDEWAEFLARRRIPVIAGPLISFSEQDVPDWMFIWEHDFDTLRELTNEFIRKVVQRYRRTVGAWNVVAGLNTNSVFTLSFEQMIELTRVLVGQVKMLLPAAKTMVSITQPFGEYHATNGTSVPPVLYAEMISQAGIPFDAFAVDLEMGVPSPGMFTRDLFQISCLLDRFSTLGRPVYLTAVCAPGRYGPDAGDLSVGQLDSSQAGRWHRPWDPTVQAEWMDAVYRLAMSKPFIESIAWGNLADMSHTIPSGGLLDDMLQPKPSFTLLRELRDQFRQWATKR
jgi:hypothetical protein